MVTFKLNKSEVKNYLQKNFYNHTIKVAFDKWYDEDTIVINLGDNNIIEISDYDIKCILSKFQEFEFIDMDQDHQIFINEINGKEYD